MGTYYALGVVQDFNARTKKSLTRQQWEKILHERLNLDLFNVAVNNDSFSGTIKPEIFKKNIANLFQKLKDITGEIRAVDYYFISYGDDISQYPTECCEVNLSDSEGNQIELQTNLVLLFIEGKVSVEEFQIEPMLMNWLFRHSNFGNPLAGAIMSGIVG